MNPIKFKGVTYPSVTALANARGIPGRTLSNRIAQGHTVKYSLSADQLKGRTLRAINLRGEWISDKSMGWSIEGLCTSGIWAQWVKVLTLLYRDFSSPAIADLFGVAPRTIQMDIKRCGIEARSKGGSNYQGHVTC